MECRESVTFHNDSLDHEICECIVIGDTSVEWFYRVNTQNRTRCNTGGELNKLFSSTSES